MRIAHVMLSSGWGGAERFVLDLADGISRDGHEQLVVVRHAFERGEAFEEIPGVTVCRIPARGNWDVFSVRPMVGAARRFGPDIVHGNLARGSWMAGRMGRALGIPVLVTLHNYMRPKYARNVDYFATITRDAAEYVKGWGVDPERVRWIPNFSTFPPVESPTLFRSEPPTFVALGRFAPMKGFDLLVRAFRATLDRAGPARLVLGGSGPDEAELRRDVERLGLGPHVDFPGWVEDVMAFLGRGDVFVMSSRHEPFGIVVLEAMAAGKVIVSSLAEGPREILDESTAYLAELESVDSLADAMVRSITERTESERKARTGLELYRNEYRAEKVIPRYIEYYRDILGSVAGDR